MIYYFTINNNIKLNVVSHTINNPKAILIHLHGLGCHFQNIFESNDNFENRIKFFEPLSIVSYALELRGHGLSSGTRFYVNDFDDYLYDLHSLIEYVRNVYPNLPIHLIGESMGGAIAIKYSIKYNNIYNNSIKYNDIKSIILLAPMCGVSSSSYYYSIYFMKALSYILPYYKMISKTKDYSSYNIKFIEAKQQCKYTNNDPIRLATARECYNTMTYISTNKNKFTTPVFAIHSKMDKTTDYYITQDFIDKCNSSNKKTIIT